MFNAAQLCFIANKLYEVNDLEGAVAEIGVASGSTSVFLNNYLGAIKSDKTYLAIDTFSGFTSEDVHYELTHRSKRGISFLTGFEVNDEKWVKWTLKKYKNVKVVKADINKIDLRSFGKLSFVLLDVDLYRPIKKALPELYEALVPGGVIVVDDCDPNNLRWDGSDQAYKEFVAEKGLELDLCFDKLGVIKKPK